VFGHRYWFFLKDAVEDVPEYLVHWESFVQCVWPFFLLWVVTDVLTFMLSYIT